MGFPKTQRLNCEPGVRNWPEKIKRIAKGLFGIILTKITAVKPADDPRCKLASPRKIFAIESSIKKPATVADIAIKNIAI